MRIVILSKDRVMQLDFLLRSLKRLKNDFEVCVLYTGNQDYNLLKCHKTLKLFKETNFQNDIVNLVKNGPEIIGFMVDDDYIFRNCKVPSFKKSYSLRLGENITKKAHFSYGFSVDGHFYYRSDILAPLQEIQFSNPNQFESRMQKFKARFMPIEHDTKSSLVGIPNNKVSEASSCSDMGGDVEDMYNKFLQGFRIKDMRIKTNNVHKEIEYKYVIRPEEVSKEVQY